MNARRTQSSDISNKEHTWGRKKIATKTWGNGREKGDEKTQGSEKCKKGNIL